MWKSIVRRRENTPSVFWMAFVFGKRYSVACSAHEIPRWQVNLKFLFCRPVLIGLAGRLFRLSLAFHFI